MGFVDEHILISD